MQDSPGYTELLKDKGLFDSINIEDIECTVIKYIISLYADIDRSLADLLRLHKVINDENFDVQITGFIRDSLAKPDGDGNDMLQLVGFKISNNKTGDVTFLRMEQRYKNTGLELHSPGTETRLYGDLQKSASSGSSILTSQRCDNLTQVQEEGLRRYQASISTFRGGPSTTA